MYDTKVNRHSAVVNLQMYEVYNETVKDLLQIPGMGPAYLDLEENSSDGVYVKVCHLFDVDFKRYVNPCFPEGFSGTYLYLSFHCITFSF